MMWVFHPRVYTKATRCISTNISRYWTLILIRYTSLIAVYETWKPQGTDFTALMFSECDLKWQISWDIFFNKVLPGVNVSTYILDCMVAVLQS